MYRVALNTAINQTKRPGLLIDSSSSPEILYDPSNFGKWRRPLFYCGLRRRLTKRSHHNFQVKQLESCLKEIDEESMSALTLREQRNKKRRLILIFLLALICGLLLLAFFIFR
jgi:hypothetical protein